MRCAVVTFWPDITPIVAEIAAYDVVFACEQAAYDLLRHGVSVHTVISDFDSVEITKLEQYDVKLLSLRRDKDYTDGVYLANYVYKEYPQAAITVYNSFGQRIDHALALFSLWYSGSEHVTIKTPHTLLRCFEAGTYNLPREKDYSYLSFIVLSEVRSLQIQGLKYPFMAELVPPFTDRLVSNEWTDNHEGMISFISGRLLVIYSHD